MSSSVWETRGGSSYVNQITKSASLRSCVLIMWRKTVSYEFFDLLAKSVVRIGQVARQVEHSRDGCVLQHRPVQALDVQTVKNKHLSAGVLCSECIRWGRCSVLTVLQTIAGSKCLAHSL